jgi:branched-chain amino acid transport system ATP-binding protein
MALLELVDVHAFYGTIHALQGVSLHVDAGEIVALIGSNGAGKSTTLRTISGMMPAERGTITLDGVRVDQLRAHEIGRHGICISPEGRRIFMRMTVLENLQLGAYIRNDRAGIAADIKRVFDFFPRLRERASQTGGTLSGGEQQMLAIGRAIMARPRVLLLDEPTMGLAPLLVLEIFGKLRELNEEGVTILLVEQNANMALNLASRAYILQAGRIVLAGSAKELAEDENVRRVYLGEE